MGKALEENSDKLLKKLKGIQSFYPYFFTFLHPVIENFRKKYPERDFLIDWLCFPYFEDLFCDHLDSIKWFECKLEYVKKVLGKNEYERFVDDFHQHSNSNTINGFQNKFYQFQPELLAIEHFAKQGFHVQRVIKCRKPFCNNKKRGCAGRLPDLLITKKGTVACVECKFKLSSFPVISYIYRYDRVLSWYLKEYVKIITFPYQFHTAINNSCESRESFRDLSQEDLEDIQVFLQGILFHGKKQYNKKINCKVGMKNSKKSEIKEITILYEDYPLGSNPVTIPSQAEFLNRLGLDFEKFMCGSFKENISAQLEFAKINGWNRYAFVGIQFNEKYHDIFPEKQQLINRLIKNYKNDSIQLHIKDCWGYL